MRTQLCRRLEDARITWGPYRTDEEDGTTGMFDLVLKNGTNVHVIGNSQAHWLECELPLPAWEHVSVSCQDRCPTWEEMDEVRGLFWPENEVVVQFMIRGQAKVNIHPHTLHMWRPVGIEIPMPPRECV